MGQLYRLTLSWGEQIASEHLMYPKSPVAACDCRIRYK
jgi:hypothetical protein